MMLGCFITALGLSILKASGIVTGGTAGLALSFSYLLPLSFPLLFAIINLPFFIISFKKMGKEFTFATMAAVCMVTLFSALLAKIHVAFSIHPLVGSVLGGIIIGSGTIILFMNGSSLGGAQILSITLQKQLNWNMGKTNFVFDTIVILIGVCSVGIIRALYSIISVLIISFMMSYFKEKIAKRNRAYVTPLVEKRNHKTHSIS
ncbi:hypothetical protein CWS01_09765 [Niallia nealsonii]|uniref:YitT family protein n=2 Tax=Niallia nealsonii TaxID=115979 RepID=A0A2N0Z2W8_9BACI|nr:hypothetical protein CWS01_09765 [Niallia nealsonii]